MGKINGKEGWISIGPWGGEGCIYSAYKSDGPIMQITIRYGDVIDSILFESKSRDDVVNGQSVKIGGTRGRLTAKFCIDDSVEQFSSISLTYKYYRGHTSISSLCLNTNLKKYGPFGSGGGHYVYIPIKGGIITGFFGHGGSLLDAIGIFMAPKVGNFSNSEKNVNSLDSIQDPDSAPTQLKGAENGWISLGPWGGKDGVEWAYKANEPIMKISICYGDAINSILFESKSCGDVLIVSSEKFGDTGGHTTKMFCIDSLVEQLSSISLTYDVNRGKGKIISLCFETNVGNKHGPYGSRRGAYSVSIPIQGGVIVGFHGRGETYLTAIGVFLAPKVNGLHSIIDHYYAESQLEGKIISEEGWISLGPWGGEGAEYSVFKLEGPIMQITIRYKWQGIKSILFENKSHNDVRRNYVKIGGNGGSALEKLRIDISEEQLTSISLTYKDYLRHPVISSLRFNTNLRTYGPYGSEEGHYVSIDSIPREGEVIAGFHGRGKTWLHAIGIFLAPKVNSFSNSKKNVNSLNSIQHPDSAPTQLKGNIGDEEGWVSYGPCGGNDGVNWVYKPHGPIMQITVCYGQVIDSILFESKSCDGVLIGSSQKIGGTGGHMIEMFCINSSEEQLSSISVTYNSFFGKVTIISLCFCTNINNYGPFGSRAGASSDSIVIPIEGGVVTGFHGRVRTHLTAIGVLVAPKVNSLPPIQDPNSAPTQFKLQLRRAQNMGIVMRDGPSNDNRVAKEKEKPEGKCNEKEMVTSMGRGKENDIQVMLGSGVGSKLKTLENNIHSVASSSATTNKDDHHGGAPSPSSEMIRKDLDLVDSAFQKYIMYMDMQISETREKLKELQKLGSSERDFDELGKAIAKLKFQIPLTTNKHDHHGGALSPTSKMIRSDLILVDMAFAETKESMYHMNVKINQAHEKFEELELSPSSERDSDKLRKAKSDELRKAIAKLKVQSRSHNNMKTRSVDSNLHHKNWDNINGAEDEMTHFFHKEPEIAHTGDLNGVLKNFLDLPEPLRRCLSCFFKFPPMAAIKRTPMIYLWIGQGYISQYLHSEVYIWDVEVHADKIFDELIAKGFIEPIYKNCSLVPESCKMSLSVRSSLYEEAKLRGFTSNGTLDLDLGFVCGGLDGHSCLINVGEAIISCEPKIFENMKHIRSLYLGRWQSSATHHIELADAKIPHGMNKLNSLTFLSLRGISMITELPTFISELNDLTILDLRACHNLEVIPDNIGLLKSLTHLDMSECYFLEHMPKSLAHLSNLQVFKGFLIGDFDNNKQSCTLLDLSGLRKLRKLNIYFSVTDLLRLQDLKNLERFEGLKKLTISWGGCSLQDRVEDTAIAFANATLPPRLQKLDLQCFPTTSLPDNWMMPSKHLELKKLYIKGGHLCDLHEIKGEQWTVEILQLKSLSKLNMDWRKLRILFPKLIYLHQVECPKFTNFPCDERGVWMDDMAINTNLQLQKYLKTSGMISSSSNWGSSSTSARDDSNICTADEK